MKSAKYATVYYGRHMMLLDKIKLKGCILLGDIQVTETISLGFNLL